MQRKCDSCGADYDDFDHDRTCPHKFFPISQSASAHLKAQGISTDCTECGAAENGMHTPTCSGAPFNAVS